MPAVMSQNDISPTIGLFIFIFGFELNIVKSNFYSNMITCYAFPVHDALDNDEQYL